MVWSDILANIKGWIERHLPWKLHWWTAARRRRRRKNWKTNGYATLAPYSTAPVFKAAALASTVNLSEAAVPSLCKTVSKVFLFCLLCNWLSVQINRILHHISFYCNIFPFFPKIRMQDLSSCKSSILISMSIEDFIFTVLEECLNRDI